MLYKNQSIWPHPSSNLHVGQQSSPACSLIQKVLLKFSRPFSHTRDKRTPKPKSRPKTSHLCIYFAGRDSHGRLILFFSSSVLPWFDSCPPAFPPLMTRRSFVPTVLLPLSMLANLGQRTSGQAGESGWTFVCVGNDPFLPKLQKLRSRWCDQEDLVSGEGLVIPIPTFHSHFTKS